GYGPFRGRTGAARLRAAVRAQPRRPSRQPVACAATAAVRAGGGSAAARSGRAQRLRALERLGSCPDAARLWVPDRTICDRAAAHRNGASDVLGRREAATLGVPRPCSPGTLPPLAHPTR